MSTSTGPWWVPLVQATRRNLIPGLALQALACALVGAYYFLPATRGFFTSIAEAKNAGGYWFSAVAGVIAGGIIPWLVQYARGQIERELAVRDFFYIVVVWAWRGIEVDALYRLQDVLFGTGHDPLTLGQKVADVPIAGVAHGSESKRRFVAAVTGTEHELSRRTVG